jgi:hypothetical protein
VSVARRRRNRGAAIVRPSGNAAKHDKPRSIPVSASVTARISGAVSTTNDAKYRPAASLITVTEEGSAGSARDHRTTKSPILGRYSLPPSVTLNRAFLVNRIACQLSLRDRNRGGPTRRPFLVPATDAKKLR